MLAIGENGEKRIEIVKNLNEKYVAKRELEAEIYRQEKALIKLEESAYKIKIFACTYYLPAEDIELWRPEKCPYNLDVSSFYCRSGWALLNNRINDVRERIRLILTEHKGLEDWNILGILLLENYENNPPEKNN